MHILKLLDLKKTNDLPKKNSTSTGLSDEKNYYETGLLSYGYYGR